VMPKRLSSAEEEPGRIKLIFAGELWFLGEGGIENVGVGLGDEKTRGISVAITLNLTSREIWSVLGHSPLHATPLRSTVTRSYKCITNAVCLEQRR